MSQYFIAAILFALILSGCVPNHFVERNTYSLIFYLQKPEAKRVLREMAHEARQDYHAGRK